MQSAGYISAVHGDVVEIEFSGELPPINDALLVTGPDKRSIILEVSGHASPTTVKSIALGFTQGLKRGMTVTRAGGPLTIPVNRNCLGPAFSRARGTDACLRYS
jgi:F-type H+-transporting ATPase subunit beta